MTDAVARAFASIDVNKLRIIWQNAQREFILQWANELADKWDWALYEPMIISPEIEGRHHIAVGQHRAWAIRKRFGPTARAVCMIDPTITDAANAARVFNLYADHKRLKPVRQFDTFSVKIAQGNEVNIEVDRIVRGCGYHVSRANDKTGIMAIESLLYIFNKYGPRMLDSVLTVINSTWGYNPDAVKAKMLKGYVSFLAAYPNVDTRRLITRVVKEYPAPQRLLIAVRAHADMVRATPESAFKSLLVKLYNHGLGEGSRINPDVE